MYISGNKTKVINYDKIAQYRKDFVKGENVSI